MKKPTTPPEDEFEIRCPRLGHQICFSYCRFEDQGFPCFKILDCWHGHFTVETFLQSELPPEAWARLLNRKTKPKMLSLLELIEQAKKKKEDEQKDL